MLSTRTARTIAGYTAIVSALPYLALKMIWLAGGTLGVADTAMMHDTSMVALNAITAGMDLVGIGLALAFTHQWGLRIPAWLLLPPMWVATGLLARFIVAVPIAVVVGWLMPAAVPRVIGGPVAPWVYAVVYTEFAGMGVGLIAAFFFYARVRWVTLSDAPAAATQRTPTRVLEVALAKPAPSSPRCWVRCSWCGRSAARLASTPPPRRDEPWPGRSSTASTAC